MAGNKLELPFQPTGHWQVLGQSCPVEPAPERQLYSALAPFDLVRGNIRQPWSVPGSSQSSPSYDAAILNLHRIVIATRRSLEWARKDANMPSFGNLRTYDHCFCRETLSKTLRKSDFFDMRALHDESVKLSVIDAAVESACSLFSGKNPLVRFPLKGNQVYSLDSLPNELAVRKLNENIARLVSIRPPARDVIVSNLRHLIGEGVPYRLYRLDIRKFYESFSTTAVEERIVRLPGLSPPSKGLLRALLSHYVSLGGTGLPRGLALSALLAEIMMQEFDLAVRSMSGVYFFSRYVDDIVIMTSSNENPKVFRRDIVRYLPAGLVLHERKRQICSLSDIVTPIKPSPIVAKISFDYLGYRFAVYEPAKVANKKRGQYSRDVVVDIADSKLRRIKTRVVRSFMDFVATGDFDLMRLRIKFLTSNFRIKDFRRERSKLSGIYYSYPEITDPASIGLRELDKFLANAVLSKNGRVFSKSSAALTANQRCLLLKHSFVRGHQKRLMVHLHPTTIAKIQECWANE